MRPSGPEVSGLKPNSSSTDVAAKAATATLVKRPLIAQRIAVRHLLRVGLVKRFAKFAAVNFRVLPDLGLHFLWIVVPPLEMPGAKFSLGILFIARALPGLAHLDLLFRRARFRSPRERRQPQRAELREAPGAVLPVMRLAVWSPRPFVGSPLSVRMRVQDRFLRVSFVSYSNPSTETKRDFGSTDFQSVGFEFGTT